MIIYAIDCASPGEFSLAQVIAHKKGYFWCHGAPDRIIPGKNKRLHLHPNGGLTHGRYRCSYYRSKNIDLVELNRLGAL